MIAMVEMRLASDADRGRRGFDPVARLREHAENMGTTAAALKRIADAADPLYKTLDDGQKRRLAILTHMERPFWRRRRSGHREFWRNREGGESQRRQRPRSQW